jgi:hypothetical protein
MKRHKCRAPAAFDRVIWSREVDQLLVPAKPLIEIQQCRLKPLRLILSMLNPVFSINTQPLLDAIELPGI